jgi:mono/diheme cytochrome c family protein
MSRSKRRGLAAAAVAGCLAGVALSMSSALASGPTPPWSGAPWEPVDSAQVMRGRALTLNHACGGCHGGGANPTSPNWLSGARTPENEFRIGPCADTPGAQPCFHTRPRNLTPDNTTGLGRFSERQIFNALRFGLRPGETPDVEITSHTPGQGSFPEHPKYLAPPMPWPEWRHMTDQELWDIAAYLKHGVKPVSNRVADSEGPPDFWASAYTEEKIGPYPAAPFPTAQEELRP